MSATQVAAPLLAVSDLHVSYGAVSALKGISFDVIEGEIVTLIGANGAGKSTTLNTIVGLVKARKACVIEYRGKPITNQHAYQIVRQG
jgi:branched-chain amino acid transport system ATP-binding protein